MRDPGQRASVDVGWLEVVEQMDEQQLRDLVASMPLIEQAKGVLMGYYGCEPARAFAILRRWSSVHHLKIRDLAVLVVEHTSSRRPDPADRRAEDEQWAPFHAVRAFLDGRETG